MLVIHHTEIKRETGEDVSDHLVEFLWEEVDITKSQFQLKDVFLWVKKNPVLRAIYRRSFIEELAEEADKGPSESSIAAYWRKQQGCWAVEDLDYLELQAQEVEYNQRLQQVNGSDRLTLCGIGLPLKEDGDLGKQGECVRFSVSVTPLRDLLNFQVKVSTRWRVTQGDEARRSYGQELLAVEKKSVSLGRIIDGLLWELSFHGGPAGQAEFREELDVALQELEGIKRGQDNDQAVSMEIQNQEGPVPEEETGDDADRRFTNIDDMECFYELGAQSFDALVDSVGLSDWMKNKVVSGIRQKEDEDIMDLKTLIQEAQKKEGNRVKEEGGGWRDGQSDWEEAVKNCQWKEEVRRWTPEERTAFHLRVLMLNAREGREE